MKNFLRINAVVTGLLLSSSVVPVALADDTEIYTTPSALVSGSNPNILFIVDNSISMEAESEVKDNFDVDETYDGICEPDGIYFTDDGEIPDCSEANINWFNRSALVCDHAITAWSDTDMRDPSEPGPMGLIGTYSDQLAQFDPVGDKWRELDITAVAAATERDYLVECMEDSGLHGVSTGGDRYIKDVSSGYTNSAPVNPEVPHAVWSAGVGNLQLFDGNYINYLSDKTVPLVDKTRLEQVQRAVEIMVRGNTRVDIGLMVFDTQTEPSSQERTGGAVIYPILDVSASRNDFFSALKTLKPEAGTQLAETYYEALRYYGGKGVDFGVSTSPPVEGAALQSGNNFYKSPITGICDKNYIVVLSDGAPTFDDVSTTRQATINGFDSGSCNKNVTSDYTDDNLNADVDSDTNMRLATDDNCLDELSDWAFTNDVATDGSAAHQGEQNITTHTIGWTLEGADKFGLDLDAASDLLEATANRGGGVFYQADSEAELIDIFNQIIASALKVDSTFSSPAVSVNAFNRSTHLEDLYFTLFKPSDRKHWDGNLKKYKLQYEVDTADANGNGDVTERLPFIADQLGAHAVDGSTGFFSDTAKSFWTSGDADGKDVAAGGSANVLTNARNVYTFTGAYAASGAPAPGSGSLTTSANAVKATNASLTDAMLNIISETANSEEIISGTSYRETLINWAAGKDALNEYGAANTFGDARVQMGDPLHAQPALVQYGKNTDGTPDLIVYIATNDGYLHAVSSDDGTEIFSFIPQELLPNLKKSMEDEGGSKLYGLDGNVVVWINDANNDGTISGAGEHVYLYVTMRRGGKNIYALDVTSRTSPKLMWVIKGGTGDYKELAQTWSTVNVAKIKDGAAERQVLIFGGGYDKDQDTASVTTEDDEGRTVYIADATTGARLWTGGADATSPIASMNFSIPARINILDISGDGYIDRMYAADMGGQIFRFDINNSNGQALSDSIIGGRIADLAEASVLPKENRVESNARRFYYPPDVALLDANDGPFHGLVISSGYRAHPLNTAIHDQIYMIKDRFTGPITSTANYDVAVEGDLYNATVNLAGGDSATKADMDDEQQKIIGLEGWRIDLDDESNPGSWIGEKGLAEALIIEGTAIVTTYTPDLSISTNSCDPNIGIGKVFFLNILDATSAFPSNLDLRSERHVTLKRGGIPPSPNVIITEGGVPTLCIGTECEKANFDLGVRKTYWYEVTE
jgi:type IV pilus assembly protein PilY1